MSEDQSEHAKLSPSGSKRWFACPGSLTLERDFPDSANTFSDDGTAMHTISARVLTTPGTVADQFVHELVPVHYKTEDPRYVRFTDEMAELVNGYVTSLRAIAAGDPIMVEQRVDFSEFVNVPGQFGTLDAGILFLEAGELFIGDLKTGYTPVEVEDNSQLMFYGLGLLRKILDADLGTTHTEPFAYARALGLDKIRLGIYQPRTTGGWTEWTCTLDDLKDFADLARQKASTVAGAESMYGKLPADEWERIYLNPKPNDKDCAFCKAMAVCPSMRSKVEETVGADFEEVGTWKAIPPPTTPNGLAAALFVVPMLEQWATAVRAEVERRLLLDDKAVPGFGLELGRKGARKFKDEAAAEILMRKNWRLTIEDCYDMKLKSPTSLEKLSKPTKVDDGTGKVVTLKPVIGPRRWTELAAMVTQASPKPSVKPIKDIKTPYVPTQLAADDFSTVAESNKP